VWFYGSITSRTTGSAIFFFTTFAIFDVIFFVAARRTTRAVDDPSKNYIEVDGFRLSLTLAGHKSLDTYRSVTSRRDVRLQSSSPPFHRESMALVAGRVHAQA